MSEQRDATSSVKDLIFQAKCRLAPTAISGSTVTGHAWLHTGDDLEAMFKWLEAELSAPSETPQKPVDPESEAANPVWDLVIAKCHSAYPERQGMSWGESPLELITEIINERDEARAAVYEIKHVAYHFLESGEERVSDSEVAFDLPNEDYDKFVALIGDAHPEPETSALSAIPRSEPDEDGERYRWFRDECGQDRRIEILELAGEFPEMLDHHIDKGRCGL